MKSILEVHHDGETLDVVLVPYRGTSSPIRDAHEQGFRIIWNHRGMRGIVPPAVLDGLYSIVDDFKRRLRQHAEVPPELGQVTWDQCVPIPANGPHGPGHVSIES